MKAYNIEFMIKGSSQVYSKIVDASKRKFAENKLKRMNKLGPIKIVSISVVGYY